MDSFTKTVRKQTDCPYCEVPICRACLQTCLLMDNAAEPVCPSCRAAWSREFLNDQLTASFRNGPFKKYREKILLDRERARLPETQEEAARYKAAVEFLKPIDEKIKALRTKIDELPSKKAVVKAQNDYYACRKGTTHAEWLETRTPLYHAYELARKLNQTETLAVRKQIKALNKGTRGHRYTKSSFGHAYVPYVPLTAAQNALLMAGVPYNQVVQGTRTVEEKKKPVFIQKCPASTCEGFLSTQWVCGLCNIKVCKDCHEPKTDTAIHMCDPELVESIKAIKKEAKPCPKCAAQISKIDGCDQMWCTQCKTAFSWNTGKIEEHIIHNPHYFQWMRENGQVVPRAPGDVAPPNPCAARGALDAQLQTILTTRDGGAAKVVEDVRQFLRLFLEIEHEHLRNHRHTLQDNERDEWRRQLRVQRMVNEINDDKWKQTLQRKEKETHKARDKLQLLEMYHTAGKEIMGQVMTGVDIEEIHKQLRALCEFTDKAAKKMTDGYKCADMKLDPENRGTIARRWYM